MAHQRLTAAHVEKKMQRDRVVEAKHNDLISFTSNTQKQSFENRSEQLVGMRRRANMDAKIAAESMFDMSASKRAQSDMSASRLGEQNALLAQQISKKRAERERAEREVQRICEGSDVLRELESKLQTAYMNRERAGQLEEAALKNEMEMQQEQDMSNRMEIDRQNALAEMEFQDALRRQHNILGREELEMQMQDAHYQDMMEAQEEAQRDQKMVSQIVRKFEEEDYHDYMSKLKKVQDTQEAINGYKLQREEELREAARRHKAE